MKLGRRPLTGEFDAHKDTDSKTSLAPAIG